MNTEHRDPRLDDSRFAEEAPDALDRLIAEIRVPVTPGFCRQVMSRLPEGHRHRDRAARREWAIAGSLAVLLAALAAVLVAGGGGAAPGVAGSIVDLVIATVAAGGGFLAASWRGLGQAVGAALDGSATALLALGFVALAANGLLVLLLRRRRAAARASDES